VAASAIEWSSPEELVLSRVSDLPDGRGKYFEIEDIMFVYSFAQLSNQQPTF
jgi:hypothetical protein